MDRIKYNLNQSVFKAGDAPDKMYLLVKGKVGIFLPKNDTKTPNFIIEENELFGEMGVIENQLRMATARCIEECEIIEVSNPIFNDRVKVEELFNEDPQGLSLIHI